MGRDYPELHRGIISALQVCAVVVLTVAGMLLPMHTNAGDDELNLPATARNFVLPQYNKSGELQYIIYGAEGKNHGALVDLTDVVIDLMKIDQWQKVKIDNSLYKRCYLQGISEPETFWTTEKQCSQGMVFSSTAELHRTKEKVRSDAKVAFRSQYLDADGIGFDADLDAQRIHIRKHVVVTIRTGAYAARREKQHSQEDNKSSVKGETIK